MEVTFTEENISAFCAARDRGEKCEISPELFNYFMEVLPPVFMSRWVKLVSGIQRHVLFGFAEGADVITAFWREGRNGYEKPSYFAQQTVLRSSGY